MRIALNIIWLVFAGLWATILWCIAGIVMPFIRLPFGRRHLIGQRQKFWAVRHRTAELHRWRRMLQARA